jgi:hypothetical protein
MMRDLTVTELTTAYCELGVVMANPTGDQVAMGHVRAAYAILRAALYSEEEEGQECPF